LGELWDATEEPDPAITALVPVGDHEPDHGLGFHDITAARQPV